MKNKILFLGICVIFAIVAASFATATTMQNESTKKEKISPLYRIRTSIAIGEKVQEIRNNLKERLSQRILIFSNSIPLRTRIFQNEELRQLGRTDYVPLCLFTSGVTFCKCQMNNNANENQYDEQDLTPMPTKFEWWCPTRGPCKI